MSQRVSVSDQFYAGKKIVRANYDFSLTQDGDLPMKRGDVLEVISE